MLSNTLLIESLLNDKVGVITHKMCYINGSFIKNTANFRVGAIKYASQQVTSLGFNGNLAVPVAAKIENIPCSISFTSKSPAEMITLLNPTKPVIFELYENQQNFGDDRKTSFTGYRTYVIGFPMEATPGENNGKSYSVQPAYIKIEYKLHSVYLNIFEWDSITGNTIVAGEKLIGNDELYII